MTMPSELSNRAFPLFRWRVASYLSLIASVVFGFSISAVQAATLPSTLSAHIEQQLPTYSWAENAAHHVQADFDGNGLDDVALLLNNEDDWQLAVFQQLPDERYESHVIDYFPGADKVFKQSLPIDQLTLNAIKPASQLTVQETLISGTNDEVPSLVLQLPAEQQMVMLFQWNSSRQLFGSSRIRLSATPSTRASINTSFCSYDPSSGVPNPLGTRAFITIQQQDENAVVVYQRFPSPLNGSAAATLAVRHELVFHQTTLDAARTLMREQPDYYQALTGDNDPDGFALIDESLVCQ